MLVLLCCLLPLVTSQPSIVLTFDTSGSMEIGNRLETLGLALVDWFDHIPDNVLVGMVAFNTDEEILSDLTTSRTQLIDKFSYDCDGATCIGCGVRAALQVLGDKASHGVIVLITDGENTEPGGFISDVQGEVVASGTTVVAIGIGDEAPITALKELASATRGLFFEVVGDRQQELLDPLNRALQLAQYLVNPTTTTTTIEHSEESVPTRTNTITQVHKNSNITMSRETSRVFPVWLVVVVTAAGFGALLLVAVVVLLVWRQLFVPQTSGFYQVAYSDSDHRR